MAIVSEELNLYKSQIVNDTATNGSRLSSNEIVSGVANNLWPDVTEAQRVAGSAHYRKVFVKVDNADDLILYNAGIFVEKFTPADDRVVMFAATQIDTFSDVTGSERLYGCGWLSAQANSGQNTLSVEVEDGTEIIFVDGDTIRISDKATPTSGTGNEELVTIVGTPGIAGDVVTITLVENLINTYVLGAGSRVHAVYSPGNLQTGYADVVVTSTSGTFDPAEITFDNIGTVYEEFTLTIDATGTGFSVSGDTLGDLGTGTVGVSFAPTNPDFSRPYLTIPATAWGGTYLENDTVVFKSTPAAIPVWEKRIVPAGTASYAGNTAVVGILGESSSA